MLKTYEYVDFSEGVQAAELSGWWVDHCQELLESLQPIVSIEEERSLFKSIEGFHLKNEAVSHDMHIDVVLVSRTGALALKGSKETDWSVPFQLAKTLDGGNYIHPISVRFIDNGELIFSQAPSPLEIDGIVADFSIPDTIDGIE